MMNDRIDDLSRKLNDRDRVSNESQSWADRSNSIDPADIEASLNFFEEEGQMEETVHRPLIQVSDDTTRLIKGTFKKPANNATRLHYRKGFSFPNVEDTKCPKLDPMIKQNLSKEAKDADASVVKLQTLTLDAIAPLVHIVEEAQKGTLSSQKAAIAAKASIALIGNASVQMSRVRRKRILKELNRDLTPLAENTEMFEDATPLLFGDSFEKKMKEHVDALKCLRSNLGNPPRAGHFFPRG
jgi:hypothetical protein